MKLKICLLMLICSFGYEALADAIVDRTVYPRNSLAKQSSIVRSSIYENRVTTEDYNLIINDLINQIQDTPDNYSLYIALTDAYIKSQNYFEAFNKLTFLKEQKDNNKLSEENLNEIRSLFLNIVEYSKYFRYKSSIYVNLAVLALLNDNNQAAEKYIKNSVRSFNDRGLVLDGIKFVFDYTGNYVDAVSVCNLFISLNRDESNDIRKLKVYFLTKNENLNAAVIEYKEIQNLDDDISNDQKYELFKLMEKQNFSDKKIASILYSQNGDNIEKSYYDIYNLLIEFDDKESSSVYAEKIQKNYPDSIVAKFIEIDKLIKAGKNKEALDALNAVKSKVSTEQDITTYNVLSSSIYSDKQQEIINLMMQGYYQQALDILNSKDIIETDHILAYKARCYMELGQMQNALENLNRAVAFNPNSFIVYLQFGYYYFYNADYETSNKYAEKALNFVSNDSESAMVNNLIKKLNEISAGNYINQIISAFDSQNYIEAMRLTDEALNIDPTSSILYFYKGIIYIAQNNYAASTAALYKAIELDKNNVLAYFYLGFAFDNLSEQKNALNCYEKFIQLLPKDEFQENEKAEYAKTRIQKIKMMK